MQKPLISAHFMNDVHLFCNAAIVDQDEHHKSQKKNILELKDSVTKKNSRTYYLIQDIDKSYTLLAYRSTLNSKLSTDSALHEKE